MNTEQERAFEQILHSVQQAQIPGNDWRRELKLIESTCRAALQSQDDWISPTSLTGLEKDELIRQLQWALGYWMPPIAGEDTPDGERASKEAYLLLGMRTPVGRENENTPSYWEKREALQSQDREDAERLDWLQQSDGRFHKLLHITSIVGRGFSPTNSSDKWFSSLREAIDHARRIEGEGE